MLFTMEKERLGAFMYAVLAIIMTILVLDLKEPKTFDLPVSYTHLTLPTKA